MDFGILLLGGYGIGVNVIGMYSMGKDKSAARKNTAVKERTSEGLLFFIAILGGAVGVYIGMFLFRHKTQKLYFLLGIPLLITQQFLLLYFLYAFFLNI